jgi:hypothetical protein
LLTKEKRVEIVESAFNKMEAGEGLGVPGYVIPGDGGKLRRSPIAIGNEPEWIRNKANADAHHLIPSALVTTDPALTFFERVGFDSSCGSNGIYYQKEQELLELRIYRFIMDHMQDILVQSKP